MRGFQVNTVSIVELTQLRSGCNPEALDIAMVELSGETEVKLVRLYTKGVPPKMPLQKIFGVTSTELG